MLKNYFLERSKVFNSIKFWLNLKKETNFSFQQKHVWRNKIKQGNVVDRVEFMQLSRKKMIFWNQVDDGQTMKQNFSEVSG